MLCTNLSSTEQVPFQSFYSVFQFYVLRYKSFYFLERMNYGGMIFAAKFFPDLRVGALGKFTADIDRYLARHDQSFQSFVGFKISDLEFEIVRNMFLDHIDTDFPGLVDNYVFQNVLRHGE